MLNFILSLLAYIRTGVIMTIEPLAMLHVGLPIPEHFARTGITVLKIFNPGIPVLAPVLMDFSKLEN
jgi:hypothetical protein